MKRRHLRVVAAALVALALSSLAAPALAQAEPGLVGTWRAQGDANVVLKLGADSTGSLNGAPFSYAVLGDKLVVKDGDKVSSYTFRLRGGVLGLLTEDGKVVAFERAGGAEDPPRADARPGRVEQEERPAQRQQRRAGAGALVGRWVSSEGTADVRDDGTLTFNGQTMRYRVEGDVITLITEEGALPLPFRLSGDTLTVTVDGQEVTYRRESESAGGDGRAGGGGGGTHPPELLGKWCYMANVSSYGGGRMSNRCFTLYANGTYEYYAETSSSGAVASSASQEYDAGTWTATRNSITANSRTQGTRTHQLEKRNHPKTGDPMLVLDGDAYVTATQRPPWP